MSGQEISYCKQKIGQMATIPHKCLYCQSIKWTVLKVQRPIALNLRVDLDHSRVKPEHLRVNLEHLGMNPEHLGVNCEHLRVKYEHLGVKLNILK